MGGFSNQKTKKKNASACAIRCILHSTGTTAKSILHATPLQPTSDRSYAAPKTVCSSEDITVNVEYDVCPWYTYSRVYRQDIDEK